MRLPKWIAWMFVRAIMELTVIRLRLRGMPRLEARRRVGEATKLYMHREVCPQLGPPDRVSPGGKK